MKHVYSPAYSLLNSEVIKCGYYEEITLVSTEKLLPLKLKQNLLINCHKNWIKNTEDITMLLMLVIILI